MNTSGKYIDGFLLPIPTVKLVEYRALAIRLDHCNFSITLCEQL
jgi:uncharacterized protein YbaA (DUF1428 family)